MTPEGLPVHGLESLEEMDAYFLLATGDFASEVPADEQVQRARRWRDYLLSTPSYHPGQLRGAFLGGSLVGGLNLIERWLRYGPVRLRVGCLQGLVVQSDLRRQGIGQALMADTLAYARSRQEALVILDGIQGYYRRLGYADILDRTEHALACRDILALPESPYHIRHAALADAAALLGLYQRHFGNYLGHFERSLDEQRREIESRPAFNPILMAVDRDDQPRGYLLFDWEHQGVTGAEVTADDWPAALALLQHHAAGAIKLDPPADEIRWPLPLGSSTLYILSERLDLRSETRVGPDNNWLARPASLPALFQSLLPLWEERWARARAPWTGVMSLEVGETEGAVCGLKLEDGDLSMVAPDPLSAPTAHFSSPAFTQLVFGYRPLSWLAGQPDQSLPRELMAALEILFPPLVAWIPGTDAF